MKGRGAQGRAALSARRPAAGGVGARRLESPLCELGLSIRGTQFERHIRSLRGELAGAGIALRPTFYLSTEYGTVIRTANVALLWTDGVTWGRRLARSNGLRVRTPDEMLITLRHETGHAFSYVHRLYRTQRFRRLFGVRGHFFGTYPEAGWRPGPSEEERFRRGEVIKLYAARHPDEDFAICFQTWLAAKARNGAGDGDLQAAFADRPVILQKLQYVEEVVRAYGRRPAAWDETDLDEPFDEVLYTVAEWLRRAKDGGSYNLLPSHPVA
ncbi:MAG: hypothetical protein HYZ53_15340 [Planctomycetes bacterium]|nr:hypothetical protein [Planctomycetota bacterium]